MSLSNIELYSVEGIPFEVNISKIECAVLPKKGDVVTFSYDNYTSLGVPVNPKIVQIRTDVSWEQLTDDHFADSTRFNGTT